MVNWLLFIPLRGWVNLYQDNMLDHIYLKCE
jgi:hypothetical protein